jgi:hypothetical protein
MNKNVALLVCAAMLCFAVLGCTFSVPTLNVGALEEVKHAIALDGATSADVQLLIGTGELTVSPGAAGLLDGTFRYNVKEWKPELERSKVGELASVLVRQGADKESWGIAGKGARNEWDIRLSNKVPLRLTIAMGAGESKLDLSGLRLSRLNVDGGAGDTLISFNAPNPETLSAVDVNSGAGKVELRSVGNASPEKLNIKGGAGEVVLDLNGAWGRSAQIEVITGVGKVTLKLPTEIGVKVNTGISPVGKVVVEGLTAADGGYVNDKYATAEIKLDISLTTGIGEVNITTK